MLSGTGHLSNRNDDLRRLIHLLAGGCAFLLQPLGPFWGALLAASALAYNALVAPAFGLDRAYRREGEGRWGGLTTYPLAVLLLLLLRASGVEARDPLAATGSGAPDTLTKVVVRRQEIGRAHV